MNCKKINEQIDMIEYLAQNNINPIKENENEAWFLSPFRNEKTASFKVNIKSNRYYDFGEGAGGTLVDLIMRLEQISIKEIIDKFSDTFFSFQKQIEGVTIFAPQKKKDYEILKLNEISSLPLIQYLNERNLSIDIVKRYCKEIHYKLNQKKYYAIAFPNQSNGFEVRNKYVKMCLVKKDISLIENGQILLKIFESWSDFISYIFLKPLDEFAYDFLILNSISLLKRNLNLLKKYRIIETYFDNDQSGKLTTNFLLDEFGSMINNQSNLYQEFKDLNEFIQKKQM